MVINRWSGELDLPFNEPIYCGNPSNEIWTMRDGAQIRVGAMTDLHLRNCWKMVEGKSPIWEQIFEAETKKRIKGGINETT
jgi:hypothetical protein